MPNVIEKIDGTATPLTSVRATLYQLERYHQVQIIEGKRAVVVPAWAMEAMKVWLREAQIQLEYE